LLDAYDQHSQVHELRLRRYSDQSVYVSHIHTLNSASSVGIRRVKKMLEMSRFLSRTCTEVSGVENTGQCGRLSQLHWLLGAL